MSSTPGAGARSLVLTVPRSPSTSHVRLWIWRRDSFISCLAWRRASWFRLAASDRSAYCGEGGNSGVSGPDGPFSPSAPPFQALPNPPVPSDLGLVPLFCLLQVLRRDAFVLGSDVPQRRCQLGLHGRLHLDVLHLLALHAQLQVSQLLSPRARCRVHRTDPTRAAQLTRRKEKKHLNEQKGAPGSAGRLGLRSSRPAGTVIGQVTGVHLRCSPPGGAGV